MIASVPRAGSIFFLLIYEQEIEIVNLAYVLYMQDH